MLLYFWLRQNQCIARARGARARARVSVNFHKFSPCMAPARRAHVGLTVYPPSRTLEARFIRRKKPEVSKRQYLSKANSFNVRDFSAAKNTVLNLVYPMTHASWDHAL